MTASLFTVTVECPRLYFEQGQPEECGCDIAVECEVFGTYKPATRSEPAEQPTRTLLSDIVRCPKHASDYTDIEQAEFDRRARQRMERHDFDAEAGFPCRCPEGDCRC